MAIDEERLPQTEFTLDPPRYATIYDVALRGYEEFYAALAGLDDRIEVPSDRSEWEVARLRALSHLPPPHSTIPPSVPLRVLALIAGNASWGALETFYHQPPLRDRDSPASEPLRSWYRQYEEDLAVLFPEHRQARLPEREDWAEEGYEQLPAELQARGAVFVAAKGGKGIDADIALGILLRDYAADLAPLSRALGFSIDELAREALDAPRGVVSTELVYDFYAGVLEQINASPRAMFLAFAMTNGTLVGDRWSPTALFAAAGIDADVGSALESISVKRHANNDNASSEDRLGFGPLVFGLRDLLDDGRTELPLSIGVTAPWGGGKSSLMLQLRDTLADSRPPDGRGWIPISFDAWKYERSERMWAALSRAIYEQGQKGWSWHRRISFRVRLQFRRDGALRLLWGPGFVFASALAVGLALLLHVSTLAGIVTLASAALGFVAVLSYLWGTLTDPFKRALDDYTKSQIYEDQLGFTSAAERDIRLLTGQLTKQAGSALIVFVDDLDRCSPDNLVEAIGTINQIFNAPAIGPCVFVLGIDRDVVTAGIEVAYAPTIEKLPTTRQDNFGLRFLSKIVQLSVAVPTPDVTAIEHLVNAASAPNVGATDAGREPRESVRHERYPEADLPGPIDFGLERRSRASEAFTVPVLGSSSDRSPSRLPPIAFDEDSVEFQEAERFAIAHLDRNPRDVKRFDNAFRLQLHVAANTPGCELTFDRNELIALAKWVVIRLRWPDFAAATDADIDLIERLETAINTGDTSVEMGLSGLREADLAWARIPAIRALLRDDRRGARIGHLHERTFLRIS